MRRGTRPIWPACRKRAPAYSPRRQRCRWCRRPPFMIFCGRSEISSKLTTNEPALSGSEKLSKYASILAAIASSARLVSSAQSSNFAAAEACLSEIPAVPFCSFATLPSTSLSFTPAIAPGTEVGACVGAGVAGKGVSVGTGVAVGVDSTGATVAGRGRGRFRRDCRLGSRYQQLTTAQQDGKNQRYTNENSVLFNGETM